MKVNEGDIIYNLVWYEMIHAKYWDQYLAEYITYKTDYRKYFNVGTLIVATIGASSWPIWSLFPNGSKIAAPLIFGAMGIAQILAIFQKNILVDEATSKGIIRLRAMYIGYFNKLECLFLQMRDIEIDKEQATEYYYQLRETVYSMEELKDSLNIKQKDSVDEKGHKRVLDYLRPRYLTS